VNVLEVEQLHAAYRKNTVLNNVSLEIQSGSLTGIVGPNGAGKSTLIKALLQLHPTLSGRVEFFGTSLKQVKAKVGYVPQRGSVDWDFPTNALDVVMMGMYGQIGWFKWPNQTHKKKALEALDKVGMTAYADRQISELSGGQQQRVFLARALIQQAELYFMDEPLAGVDAATERAIMTILRELKNEGKTVLVVHHDLQTVEDYFDNVLFLNRTVVAHGKTTTTFTAENIEKTYGGAIRWIKEGKGYVHPTIQ
jgi:manganese/zinc/iron transport system ATP- binding protein